MKIYLPHKVRTQYDSLAIFWFLHENILWIMFYQYDQNGKNNFSKIFLISGFLGKNSVTKWRRSLCKMHKQHNTINCAVKFQVNWKIFWEELWLINISTLCLLTKTCKSNIIVWQSKRGSMCKMPYISKCWKTCHSVTLWLCFCFRTCCSN